MHGVLPEQRRLRRGAQRARRGLTHESEVPLAPIVNGFTTNSTADRARRSVWGGGSRPLWQLVREFDPTSHARVLTAAERMQDERTAYVLWLLDPSVRNDRDQYSGRWAWEQITESEGTPIVGNVQSVLGPGGAVNSKTSCNPARRRNCNLPQMLQRLLKGSRRASRLYMK